MTSIDRTITPGSTAISEGGVRFGLVLIEGTLIFGCCVADPIHLFIIVEDLQHGRGMSRQQQILELIRKMGIIQAKDVEAVGISRNYLYQMHRKGLLQRNAVGLYTLPKTTITENWFLAKVAKRLPHSVVGLISALSYHEITTQIPHEIWLSIPRGSWRPTVEYPPLNVSYVSEPAYSFGIQEHVISGVAVRIYSPAKTVADCFKFRNKVGLDVAIEALREAWRFGKITIDELVEAAEVNRVAKIMRPYLEAIV